MRKEVRREMKEITHIKKAQNTRVSASPRLRIDKLDRYRPQGRNPNRHTQRGLGLLGQAISRDGYVAPMTAVADGEIIDGSARLEVVAEKLPNEVIVIEHDGTRPIVAKRMDIPNAQTEMAKRISIGANRIGQVDLDWDPDILKELSTEFDLGQFWMKDELSTLLNILPTVELVADDLDHTAKDGDMEIAIVGPIEMFTAKFMDELHKFCQRNGIRVRGDDSSRPDRRYWGSWKKGEVERPE